jgi:diguanylate cyclase (GGDEF)-like protein
MFNMGRGGAGRGQLTSGLARGIGFLLGAAAMAAAISAYVFAPPSSLIDLTALAVGWLLAVATIVVAGYLAVRHDRARRALSEAEAAISATEYDRDTQIARFSIAINHMSQGLCMFGPDRRLIVSNTRYADIYRIPREKVRPGMCLDEIIDNRIAAGNHPSMGEEALLARLAEIVARGEPAETIVEQDDGRVFLLGYVPLSDGGWVATHQDITDRRAAEAKIAFMVRHDSLTHLPNRVAFRDQLENALSYLGNDEGIAILFLDLDRFKSINDTLGHHVGDLLLCEVASRLRSCVREGDMVARLSGDEFAIVQRGSVQPTEATALASRIVEAVGAPCDLDGHQVVVNASIGIAIAPGDGTDADRLMKNADMALYRAKAEGRATFRFFEPEMDARMQARRALEADLRAAIAAEAFELHYQAIVNLNSGRIEGFEALLRWPHDERGLVSPTDFIPVAEETGLIAPLGEWVLRQACKDAVQWPEAVKVAINISALQIRSQNFVPMVAAVLQESGLAPGRLELEITETVLLQDSEGTLATLHRLRDLGTRISMDDFGTGYSSLSYLRKFPFDKIKIDRSFVRDLSKHEDSIAIVRAVAALGRSLGITTTAEGVETAEQLERVRNEGCSEVQGYFFGPPQPTVEVARLLSDRRASRRAAVA